MTLTVHNLSPERESDWTRFVLAHPRGSLFHSLEWRKVLQQTFSHTCRYVLVYEGDEVAAVLPLVTIKSIFFGKSVISVPFGVYGGIISNSAAASMALVEEARNICREVGSGYVELRHDHVPPGIELPTHDLHATFICDLPDDPTDVLMMIPRKARAEVRKARKRDDVTTESAELNLEEFHYLFALNKRKLGSPVFPKSLFLNLQQILADRCRVLTVRVGGRPVAAVMNFIWNNTLMAYYSGALDEANKVSANNLMYAASMEWAVEQGLKKFDFGRSRKDTGAYAFKKHMGFEPADLHYSYILEDGEQIPEINASNPKYRVAQNLFKHLPPFLAEKLGSFVAKRMPV